MIGGRVFIWWKPYRNKTLLHFSSLTFSPWMFHHESEKINETSNLNGSVQKTHLQKLRSFSLFLDHQKKHHHQNTFFVRSGGTGSFHHFFCLASKSWDFPKDRQENGGKQGLATRNPTTKESVNWCSLTFANPQLPAVSDPPDLQVEQSEFHIWCRWKGVMEFHPFKKSSMVATLVIFPYTQLSKSWLFWLWFFYIFPRNWVFNDLCS